MGLLGTRGRYEALTGRDSLLHLIIQLLVLLLQLALGLQHSLQIVLEPLLLTDQLIQAHN